MYFGGKLQRANAEPVGLPDWIKPVPSPSPPPRPTGSASQIGTRFFAMFSSRIWSNACVNPRDVIDELFACPSNVAVSGSNAAPGQCGAAATPSVRSAPSSWGDPAPVLSLSDESGKKGLSRVLSQVP